jgi:hypothetical protein
MAAERPTAPGTAVEGTPADGGRRWAGKGAPLRRQRTSGFRHGQQGLHQLRRRLDQWQTAQCRLGLSLLLELDATLLAPGYVRQAAVTLVVGELVVGQRGHPDAEVAHGVSSRAAGSVGALAPDSGAAVVSTAPIRGARCSSAARN